MLTELLLVGGWLFWTILLGFVLLEVVLLTWTDPERDATPIIVLAIGLAGILLFTDAIKVLTWQQWLVSGGIYVLAGVIWSIKKWYSYLVKERNYLRGIYDSQTLSVNRTDQGRIEFAREKRPKASDNKQRITTWMLLWPFSFSWWVLTWPRELFNWLYQRLSTLYDRMSERVFSS